MYVTIYEEYKHKFIQIPKIFFTSERYKVMSNNAKIAWGLLRERSSLSRKNGWFDKDTGNVYFIYQNKKLMDILNFGSESTVIKVKKELAQFDLITEIRQGLNRPNKLYLKYPIIEVDDIYAIDQFEAYEESKTTENQGTIKNEAPKNGVQELQKLQLNNTDLINTESQKKDTLDTNELTQGHWETTKYKKQYIQRAFEENTTKIPERIAKMLSVFAETENEAITYYKIILTAKKKASQELGVFIYLEDMPELEHLVINSFVRSLRKIEQSEAIENKEGYIYQAIYRTIMEDALVHGISPL